MLHIALQQRQIGVVSCLPGGIDTAQSHVAQGECERRLEAGPKLRREFGFE